MQRARGESYPELAIKIIICTFILYFETSCDSISPICKRLSFAGAAALRVKSFYSSGPFAKVQLRFYAWECAASRE
jgi:hypothetical protein